MTGALTTALLIAMFIIGLLVDVILEEDSDD